MATDDNFSLPLEKLGCLKRDLTLWILTVGARMTEAARSLASVAKSFVPTSRTRSVSHVAPRAVADYEISSQPGIVSQHIAITHG